MSTVLDTSTIINHPSVLDQKDLIVPYCVLDELDHLKNKPQIGYQARKATQKILSLNIPTKNFSVDKKETDDQLLEVAHITGHTILTDDILLYLKGQSDNLSVELFSPPNHPIYTGIKKHNFTPTERDRLYDGDVLSTNLDLYPNQFIESNKVLARYYEGGLHKVDWKYRAIDYKNLPKRQAMAANLLLDEKVTIVGLHGQAGTGKTSLAINTALQQVREGKYNKIIVSAPKVQRGARQESLGFLPGDIDEKLEPWVKPFKDNIEEQHTIQLETLPLSMIQGRNLRNSIWIITECQNVRGEEADQIIERVGAGSKLIYEGDINQRTVKSAYDALTIVTNALKDDPLAGAVELTEVKRSETAKLGEVIREHVK